jgi:hypothetical protein
MKSIISVDRASQSHHILEIMISRDSGIKRYAITFVGTFKRMLRSTVKVNFQIGAAKVFVIYWPDKSHNATRIYQKLSTRLCHMLPAYSTITDWLRKVERGDDITRRASAMGRLPDDRIDTLIASALEQCLFHSVITLCSTTKCPCTTVWRHRHSAGFIIRNLRVVPHELSPSQKAERVRMAIKLQQVLQSPKHHAW